MQRNGRDAVAVLVIDVQNVYLPGRKWECVSIIPAMENIVRLCRACRGDRMIFTRCIPSDDSPGVWQDYNRVNAAVNRDIWLNELTDAMKALADETGAPVVDKPVYSAWKSAEVRRLVGDARTVVVTGVVADCCVLSTVFDLIDAGKYVVYLKDAVSGVSRETEEATVTVLKGLEYVHLKLATVGEYLAGRASPEPVHSDRRT